MAYDYEIQYKQGKTNKAIDAFSRMNSMEVTLLAISTTSIDLYEQMQESWKQYSHLAELINQLIQGKQVKHYSYLGNQL